MKMIPLSLVAVLAATLVSCVPEERVNWSPDGTTALVHGSQSLHLATADGSPGPALEIGGGLDDAMPGGVAWLPAGDGFVFARVRPVANWAEARALIPPAETAAVEKLAPAVPGLAKVMIGASGGNSLGDALDVIQMEPTPWIVPAVSLAWESDPATLTATLAPLTDGQELIAALSGPEGKIKLHEICVQTVEAGRATGVPRVLASSLRGHGRIRVSPNGRLVAVLREGIGEHTTELMVLDLSDGQMLSVSSAANQAYDWSTDSTALVVARPVGVDGPLSGIDRLTVCTGSGKLLATMNADGAPAPLALARALLLDPAHIAVLPDGRVLFASTPARLPAAGAAATNPCLFLAAADGSGVGEVPCAPGTLPQDLRFHALSPDGRKAALVESGGTAVAVVDLSTGAVDLVEAPAPGWECRMLPAWRGSNELTYTAVRHGKPTPMRWTEKSGAREWGADWPENITSTWLKHVETKGK